MPVPPNRHLPQFTLRGLFIAVALVCAVLGWRQMARQHAVNRLWELASDRLASRRDERENDEIGEMVPRVLPREQVMTIPCFVGRIDDGTRRLIIVQVSGPMDESFRRTIRIAVVGGYGQVICIQDFVTMPNFRTVDEAKVENMRGGRSCLVLVNSFLDAAFTRSSFYTIEQSRIVEVDEDELRSSETEC